MFAVQTKHRWSLTARLVVMVVVAVALTLGLFSLLTAARLERGMGAQELAVSRLARERVGEQLWLQVQLISGELQQISDQTENAIRALADDKNTHEVLARGNIVAIDKMLKKVVATSPLDGALALDVNLKALGSHKPGLLLAHANRVFSASANAAIARNLIMGNDKRNPIVHTEYQKSSVESLSVLGLGAKEDGLVVVSLHPVFDDFGDVTAVLVAYRLVGAADTGLSRFAENEVLGVRVLDGKNVLLNGGIERGGDILPSHTRSHEMGVTTNGSYLFQCDGFDNKWRLCVYKSVTDLTELTESLVTFIKEEKRSLMIWIGLLALVSIVVAAYISSTVIRRVMAPLQQITQAVRSVAKGNWLAHVSGLRRRDEVGDIARAVEVLQHSMKERERLKADVADINQLKLQQFNIGEAAQHCRADLRQQMFALLELSENIELSTQKLISLAGLAEGEADEARLVTKRAFRDVPQNSQTVIAPAQMVNEGIDRLAETAGELSGGAHNLSIQVGSMSQEIRGVERVVKKLMATLSEPLEAEHEREKEKA